jgi:uncharacterized protein
MGTIVQAANTNPISTVVPGLYTSIVQPPLVLQGAPTNTMGVVGSASWGPVDQPVVVGNPNQCAASFGSLVARLYDLGTVVAVANLQGANSFVCVRVTDGTDTAASVTLSSEVLATAPAFYAAMAAAINGGIPGQCSASKLVTFSYSTGIVAAYYTGSTGNRLSVAVTTGSKAGTFRAVVSRPGYPSEVFDNLAAVSGAVPTAASYSLTGGTDGATNVTSETLVGSNTTPISGMYVLQNQNCAVGVLADCTDSTTWTTVDAFGDSQGIYFYVAGPAGDTIADAASTKATAGLDDYGVGVLFGDWIYWYDQVNQLTRLVSPQGFAAGVRATLAPNNSVLNKPINGIVSSQKYGAPGSGTSSGYTSADIQALVLAGIDVISNPAPGGAYWSCLVGHNSSSVASVQSDSYTLMTNFIARTINAGMGKYVGQPISLTLLQNVTSTLLALFSTMQSQGLIGGPSGGVAYSVICNASNNPQVQTGTGYAVADVSVQYQGINEKFFVNLEGGATVTIGATSASAA